MFVIAYYVTIMLLGLGVALTVLSGTEGRTSDLQRRIISAQALAEAGYERAIYDLRQDCVDDTSSPSWGDGDINGMSIGPNTSSYFDVTAYEPNSVNSGTYSVDLKNVSGDNSAIWIRSTGTVGGQSQGIEAYVKVEVVSPWHTALFGGAGSSSEVVDGNIHTRGSVHLLATSLGSSDLAMDLGGGSYIMRNNYEGLSAGLSAKIPSLTNVSFGGESVQSLGAILRVKNGQVGLTGSGIIGEADATSDAYKETVDGTYVSDGFGGTQGSGNVNSDNGTANTYDLGNTITFPSLATAYSPHASYQAYLEAVSLVISDAPSLAVLASLDPLDTFDYNDLLNGYGRLQMDGAGTLTISGKVYIKGGGLTMNKNGGDTTFTVSGSGIILVEDDITIKANVTTNGAASFPTNAIGFMTPDNIIFNESGIEVMGLFYAETGITVSTSATLIGTMVSNKFTLGTNDPTIYQVPSTVDNLPAGLIGTDATCVMKVVSWDKF